MVEVLTTGRTRDTILATCSRNIWLIAALFNIDFIFSHIPGVQNTVTDLLSRWRNHWFVTYKMVKRKFKTIEILLHFLSLT